MSSLQELEDKTLRHRELFKTVIEELQKEYPHKNIDLIGGMVYIGGKPAFNTRGYNLLYNLQTLTMELADELL